MSAENSRSNFRNFRIPPQAASVLNSKDKAPYILYCEVRVVQERNGRKSGKAKSVCVSFSTSCDVLSEDLSLLGRQMRLSVERLRIWHISPSSECEDAKMPLAMLMMQYNTQLSGWRSLSSRRTSLHDAERNEILELKVTPRIFENFFAK